MEIINQFKSYLLAKKVKSPITLKNYLSDVRRFINWYEKSFNMDFQPTEMSDEVIKLFEETNGASISGGVINHAERMSPASLKRRLSSLRQFAKFLSEKGSIGNDPFESVTNQQSTVNSQDIWHITEFKEYLKYRKEIELAIRDYVVDVHSFRRWYEHSIEPKVGNLNFPLINEQVFEQYKDSLKKDELPLEKAERKLSSLKKFVDFSVAENYLSKDLFYSSPSIKILDPEKTGSEENSKLSLEDIEERKLKLEYSSTGPIRLIQRLIIFPYLEAENKLAEKVASAVNNKKPADILRVKSRENKFTMPAFPENSAFHKKVWHHARYTRPNWYKKYHSLPIVPYIHFAVLIIFAAGAGVALYRNLVADVENPLFAAPSSPPRILSFQGRLTDNFNNPITTATDIRFSIYDDIAASGSALLWEEVHYSTIPDQDGIFSVLLGTQTSIPDNVFFENNDIYLGVTIGETDELTPRRRIASVPYAANSESLQGMLPVTDGSAGQTNVVLALDSSGDLTIGGTASPIFQATGGQFTLAGNVLLLTTGAGTNSNVIIAPDGMGMIDLQKPLVNTDTTGNLTPGGIEINDKFGILATESAVAAFLLDNNGSSDLFSASSSGVTRFTIANSGELIIPAYNTAGGILFTDADGLLSQTSAGLGGECLQSAGGSAPTWGTCGSGSNWEIVDGTLSPLSDALDILIGSNATNSAKFAILNVDGNGPATATVSGDLIVMPRDGVGGNVGIGTTNPNTYKVYVEDTGGLEALLNLDADNASIHAIRFNNKAASQTWSMYINNDDDFILRNITGGINPFSLTAAGQLQLSTSGNTGGILLGSGSYVHLYQGDTNRLDLALGDSFNIVAGDLIVNTDDLFVQQSTGRVGIGTTTPTGLFHVNGAVTGKALTILNETGDQAILTASASGTTRLVLNNAGQLQLPTNGSTGGLLLGEDVQLYRAGADHLTIPDSVQIDSSTGNSGLGLFVNHAGDSSGLSVYSDVGSSANAALVNLIADNSAFDQSAFYLQNDGVGYGLHIQNNGPSAAQFINQGGTGVGLEVYSDTGATANAPLISTVFDNTDNTQTLWYGRNDGTGALIDLNNASGQLMLLDNDGRLSLPTQGVSGGVLIGGEAHLYRGDTNRLDLGSGGSFNIVSGNLTVNTDNLFVEQSTGRTGIGTASPLARLDVRGANGTDTIASISGNTIFPALLVDNAAGAGNQIVASKSGETVFVVDNDGNLTVGPNGSGKITAAIIDPYLIQNQYTDGNTQLIFQTMAASDGDFVFQNQSTELATLFQSGLLHLQIDGSSGGLQLGEDTHLFRGATDRLDLASGDSLNLVSGEYQIGGTTVIDSSRNATFENITINGTCSGCAAGGETPFLVNAGAIYPKNSTLDFLLGEQSTGSAKFAVLNMAAGTPTASISANTANNAAYLTGTGNLGTTNMQTLTLGGSTTGNIEINSGSNLISLTGNTNVTGNADISGTLTSGTGNAFQIDASGNISTSGTTGLSLSGTGAGITFSGTNNHDITASNGTLRLGAYTLTGAVTGNSQSITGLDDLSAEGTITFSNFSNNGGILYTDGSGILAQTAAGTAGDCLLGGDTPGWGSCATGTIVSPFVEVSGAIVASNPTLDFLLGASSTVSAKFAVLDLNDSGPATASVSGNLIAMPRAGVGGRVGIGTISPSSSLSLGGTGAVNGISFGDDTGNPANLYHGSANRLDLASGDSFNIVSGNLTVNSNHFHVQQSNGHVGVGTSSPTNLFSVGSSSQFQINSSGNITSIGGALHSIENSSGALNIDSASTGAINLGTGANAKTITIGNNTGATALNFNSGTGAQTFTSLATTGTAFSFVGNSVTTGTGLALSGNALTTGTLATLTSTSTGLTTGGLLSLDWSPGSTTNALGDLFSINIGANGNIDTLFNIKDNNSSLFSVSESQIVSNLPMSFNAPGDVSMAYDLIFTNPTASYIKSSAPLAIYAGELYNSSNLTLGTYNAGNVVIDSQALVANNAATISGQLVVGTNTAPANIGNFYLTNSQTFGKALAILNQTESQDILTASASGTTRFTINSAGAIGLTGGFGSLGQCLGSNGTGSAAEWISCGSGSASNWRIAGGAISPINDTLDLLVGSNATNSAKFAVLNVNGSGPATASVSGNLIAMPRAGVGGRVGIGTINPSTRLSLGGTGAVNGISFGDDASDPVSLFRGSANRLDLGSGDSFNLLNGNISFGTSLNSIGSINNETTIKFGGMGSGVLYLNASGQSMNFNIDTDNDSTTSTFNWYANAADAAGTVLMTLREDGHLGIGTPTPSHLLSLVQTTTTGSTFGAYRNLAAASTDSPLASLIQDNSGDDQTALYLLNDGSGAGMNLVNTGGGIGMYLQNYSTAQGIFLEQNGAHSGLQVYSNVDSSSGAPLVNITADNAAFDQSALYLQNDGTGYGMQLVNTGSNIAFILDQQGNASALSIYSNIGSTANTALVNYIADNAAYDQNVLYIQNDGVGAGIRLFNGGSGTALDIDNAGTGYGLRAYSNVDSSVNSPLVDFFSDNAGFDQPVINLRQDGSGAVINAQNASTDVFTLSSAGQVLLPITGSTGGILIGGEVQLYHSDTNTLSITGHLLPDTDDALDLGSSDYAFATIYVNEILAGGSDFAEYFKKANPGEVFEDGQLVCLTSNEGVAKCDSNNSNHRLLGAISDNAAFVGGRKHANDPNYVLVGLVGQLGIRVSGNINVGDPLTLSSTPGVAVKATNEGHIIGHAMESNSGGKQRVSTSLQKSYYSPNLALNYSGDNPESLIASFNINGSGANWNITDIYGNTIKRASAFSDLIAANIKAGVINAQNIVTGSFQASTATISSLSANIINGTTATISNITTTTLNASGATVGSLAIGTENVVIAGTSLRDYVAGIIEEVLAENVFTNGNEIISPIASIETINTNIISPLADGASIEIEVKPESIAINNTSTGENVVNIDNSGNAAFSGTVTSESLQTNDATISGTLTADRLIANTIDGLDDRISSVASSLINNQPTPTTTPAPTVTPTPTPSDPDEQEEDESFISELNVGNLYADLGMYSQGLTVLGTTSMSQLTVMDSLAVGTGFIMSNNSINTLNSTLEIQSLRQSDISFMAGRVKIDTDGNVDINGNLNLAGIINAPEGVFEGIRVSSLAANIISPLPDSDLIIQLGNDGGATESGSISFLNESGNEVVRISGEGNITSSGSATFDSLNISSAGEAIASSSASATATGSAGIATLNSNTSQITIYNERVSENSLIYITPVGNTQGKVLSILEQTSQTELTDGSFTVGVSGVPATTNIRFNWLIVN